MAEREVIYLSGFTPESLLQRVPVTAIYEHTEKTEEMCYNTRNSYLEKGIVLWVVYSSRNSEA